MEHEIVLQTENLTKVFQQHRAVDGLNLNIYRGDVFGLLGPNGSGKTTTIRMIVGLIKPTAGHITLFGHMQSESAYKREALNKVGAIVEQPTFYPYLSGYDNLLGIATFAGLVRGTKIKKRIEEILIQVNLSSRVQDIYKTYSLGMKQRLGIAAALLSHPEFIILDEPTNGLDPAGVIEIRTLMSQLAQQGITLLVSSHLLYEIQQICSRVAIIQSGRLLIQGDVRELLVAHSGIVLSFGEAGRLQQAEQILSQAQQTINWLHGTQRILPEPGTWMPPDGMLLRVEISADHINDLSVVLREQNIYPTEIRVHTPSLEQLFMSLTSTTSQA